MILKNWELLYLQSLNRSLSVFLQYICNRTDHWTFQWAHFLEIIRFIFVSFCISTRNVVKFTITIRSEYILQFNHWIDSVVSKNEADNMDRRGISVDLEEVGVSDSRIVFNFPIQSLDWDLSFSDSLEISTSFLEIASKSMSLESTSAKLSKLTSYESRWASILLTISLLGCVETSSARSL